MPSVSDTINIYSVSCHRTQFGVGTDKQFILLTDDIISSQFSSVSQSCPTLCNPMNSSTPGLPIHHQLLEFTQTHVHRVSNAIKPSHPLSSPSPSAPNPSQHQGHGTTDSFPIGKGVHQGCILSPCLFNLYAEYIMRNAGLEEAQAGIKTAGRSINNLRYADDTTLMAESEEELKSLLMKVKKESEKIVLKLNIQKTKIMALVPSLHGK